MPSSAVENKTQARLTWKKTVASQARLKHHFVCQLENWLVVYLSKKYESSKPPSRYVIKTIVIGNTGE